MIKKIFFSLLVSNIFLAGSCLAQGAFPDKPITLIQGFGAGGNSDTIARIIAPGLSKELGQQVVVEAKTGAGGNIASAAVAKSPADGYTLNCCQFRSTTKESFSIVNHCSNMG